MVSVAILRDFAVLQNWMYILCDETTKTAAVIDPYASSKIIEAVGQLDGVKITHLLTTHHHDVSCKSDSFVCWSGS